MTPQPGQQATVNVSVATLWQSPRSPRAIDAPALGNPVDLDAWNRNIVSTAARADLGGRVVTQALYGEKVVVLQVRGSWAKVAVPDQPSPLDRRGYPGWMPLRQLVAGYERNARARTFFVVRKATPPPRITEARAQLRHASPGDRHDADRRVARADAGR